MADDKTREELQRIAEEDFGRSRLRDEQLEAMEHVMAGHDVLAVLPTGAGKSAIHQVPALDLDGPTLVVSPLIALQNDEMEGIEDSEAPEAVAVNSAQRGSERKDAWTALRRGSAEYLFSAARRPRGRRAHPRAEPAPAGRPHGQWPSEPPISHARVAPQLVVEVDADTAFEDARWRHPVRFARIRFDMTSDELVAPA